MDVDCILVFSIFATFSIAFLSGVELFNGNTSIVLI